MSEHGEQPQEDSIEKGKQREEVLHSFKTIGIAECVLGLLIFLLGILTVIFACMGSSWRHQASQSGHGIWCGLFSIPAGVMSISTSSKVTYFSVGWSMISSVSGSFFAFLLCCFSLGGGFETLEYQFDVVVVFNILLFIFGIAQLVLCIYSSVVFGRMYSSYPFHVRNQDYLFPCLLRSRNHSNFANVMYSTIASKKHDY